MRHVTLTFAPEAVHQWAPRALPTLRATLALGCAVLHGPNVWNFSESYAELDAQGLSQPIASADELAAAVRAHWQNAHPRTPHRPRDPKIEAMVEQLDALLTP